MIYPAVYDELVDFVAAHAAPAKLVTFHSSDESQQRSSDLLFREKYEGLSPEETYELDCFTSVGQVMNLAKATAHRWAGEPRVRQRSSK